MKRQFGHVQLFSYGINTHSQRLKRPPVKRAAN